MSGPYKIPHLGIRMVRERTITVAATRAESAVDVATVAFKLIGARPVEHLIAIMVDGRNQITAVSTLAQGGMNGIGVKPCDVLRAVLASHAAGFILAHNHPSGDPTPSGEDVIFTQKIREAALIVGLPLLDHVVVTRDAGVYRSIL